MSKYFPPYNNSSENIKVELDLSNYATKKDIKDITHVDTSSYALKTNLAALKTEVDNIDTDKLKIVPDDLAKLSDVVKNDVVEKAEYNTLKNKVDAVDTSGFVTRTKFTTDTNAVDDKIDKVEKKIPDISGLATKSSVTLLITEQENYTDRVNKKIPDISGLATKIALTAVENKIPDVSRLAAKTALTAVENKIPYVTGLITKTDFDAKLKDISDRVTKNKSKDLLLDNELKKLKTINADYFEGKDYFEGGDGTQNMLVFQVKDEYFGYNNLGKTKYPAWKFKGNSNETLYYNGGNINKKLTKPTYVSLGLDQYFFQDADKAIASSVINVYICYKLLPKIINSDNVFKIFCLVQ